MHTAPWRSTIEENDKSAFKKNYAILSKLGASDDLQMQHVKKNDLAQKCDANRSDIFDVFWWGDDGKQV